MTTESLYDGGGPPSLTYRLATLFRGLERAHGVYELLNKPNGGKKVMGKARTVSEPVTLKVWEEHLQGKRGLGIVPITDQNACWFGAIDVDQYSLRIADVEATCAQMNIPLLPTRTKSGGIHLYLFLKQPVPAALVKSRLEEFAVVLGFGGAEVFPKQNELLSDKDFGNWINMPYFGAVTGKTERYGIFNGQELTLDGFCKRAEQLRLTEENLKSITVKTAAGFDDGPPCLQSLGTKGFTPGMRNDGLFAVGVYLRKRYPDDWIAQVAAYNAKFFHPPVSDAEVKTVIKSLGRKDYSYPCSKNPIVNYCNKTLCKTRQFGVGGDADSWDLVIDSDAIKVLTDPPYWIVTINGSRVMLTAQEWTSQKLFGDKCIEKLNYFPGKLSAGRWRAEVNKILQAATEVEAPPEASNSGELLYHLQQFCTAHAQAETREEMLTGKPFNEDGWVYFRSADFKRYLEAQHFRALSGPRLYAHLRTAGLEDKQVRLDNGNNLRVWRIPEFTDQPTKVPPRQTGAVGDM